jgi:hypothetical protein
MNSSLRQLATVLSQAQNQTHLLSISKKTVFFIVAMQLVFISSTMAQCPPVGTPYPGDICQEAPIICAGLDGYCNTLSNINNQQEFPGCAANVLNNDEWLAFIPITSAISLAVIPSNCQGVSSNIGIQGAIYGNCMSQPIALQCECTENPFFLSANNLVPGQVYYLMLDGCAGDICDYAIQIQNGSVGCAPTITGPIIVCDEDTATYAIIDFIGMVLTIEWLPIPNASFTTSDDSITVVWDHSFSGKSQVCALVTDINQSIQTICRDVQVNTHTPPSPIGSTTACPFTTAAYSMIGLGSCYQGQPILWSVTNGEIEGGTHDSANINVLWTTPGIGEICISTMLGNDTVVNCLSVNIQTIAECEVGNNGNTCDSTIFLCQGLDGLNLSLNDYNYPQYFPGCPANSLNNPSWYSFMANSETVTISVTPSNCQGTNGQFGIQGAIYANCGGEPLTQQCECTDAFFMLSSDQFVPGQIYYLVLDGCAGDICDFTVEMLQGSTVCTPSIIGPSQVCVGNVVTYSFVGADPIWSIEWQPITGAVAYGNGTSAQVLWNTNVDSSQVCALVTDTNQISQLYCLDVVVESADNPFPVGSTEVCPGFYYTYAISTNSNCQYEGEFFWTWTNGIPAGSSPTDEVIYLAWAEAGEVCLNHINGTDTIANCIAVNILGEFSCLPCALLQADAGEFIIDCTTSSIDSIIVGTTNLPDSVALFQWTLNGVVVSTTPMVHVEGLGTYIFTVTNSLNGCSAFDMLEFNEDLNAPVANAEPGLPISCLNPVVTIYSVGSSTGPNIAYDWIGPNGFVSNEINPMVSTDGNYTLIVTNTENGCTASFEVTVPYLAIEVIIEVVTTPDSCHTNSGTASAGSILGVPTTYLWSTGDTTSAISGLAAGNYGITVTLGACEYSEDFAIDSLSCTGTTEMLAGIQFQVLPNPNGGQFSVLLNVAFPTTLELELVDVLGQTISTLQPMKTFGEGQHRIDFSQDWLPSGTYYLVVKNDKGRMGTKVELVR